MTQFKWREEGWLIKPEWMSEEEWVKLTPCAVCGRRGWDEWAVSDEAWKRYVPLKYQDKEVCRVCYKRFTGSGNWRNWSSWLTLHQKWVELYGEEKVRLDYESLKAVYEWLMREAGDRDVDALHIDLLLSPSMTYEDAKKVLKSALEKPLSVQEFNELIQERVKQLKEEIEELK